jgi:hypothetical protein
LAGSVILKGALQAKHALAAGIAQQGQPRWVRVNSYTP